MARLRFGPGRRPPALQRRDVLSRLVNGEPVLHLLDAAHLARTGKQPFDLVRQHRPAQGHPAFAGIHRDRAGVRDHPAECRPDPLLDDPVVGVVRAQARSGRCRESAGAVDQIVRGRLPPLAGQAPGVHHLVAHDVASACAAIGVEQVHEPRAQGEANGKRAAIRPHGASSEIACRTRWGCGA